MFVKCWEKKKKKKGTFRVRPEQKSWNGKVCIRDLPLNLVWFWKIAKGKLCAKLPLEPNCSMSDLTGSKGSVTPGTRVTQEVLRNIRTQPSEPRHCCLHAVFRGCRRRRFLSVFVLSRGPFRAACNSCLQVSSQLTTCNWIRWNSPRVSYSWHQH